VAPPPRNAHGTAAALRLSVIHLSGSPYSGAAALLTLNIIRRIMPGGDCLSPAHLSSSPLSCRAYLARIFLEEYQQLRNLTKNKLRTRQLSHRASF